MAPIQAVEALREVIIYTKPAPPFSMRPADDNAGGRTIARNAEGLTIDYLTEEPYGVMPKLIGANTRTPDVRIEMLGNNRAVLEHVGSADYCNATRHPQRLCIGAAAISITQERERVYGVDFLPSYYMSGIRLMVAENTVVEIQEFVFDSLVFLGSAAVYWLCIIVVITPLVWTSESYYCPPGKISIFHHCAQIT